MKNIRNVLESNLKRGNTYIKQYDEIENILKKYIKNEDFLKSFRSSGDAISLAIHTQYLIKNKTTKDILNDFYNKLTNHGITTEYKKMLNSEHEKIINFNNIQWSSGKISESINLNDIYTSAKNVFDAINNIVEGIIKHFVNILFFIEKNNLRSCNAKNLGDKISLLENKYSFFIINGLSLNQWRNISDHKSYCVKNGKIIGDYSNGKSIKYTINSLISVLNKITLIANALYIAFTLFMYNNLNLFKLKYQVRDEIWLDNLKIGLAAQNFLIQNILNNDAYTVTLKDCLIHKNKKDIKDRIVQASQYGLNFWPFVKKDIRIIYIDNNNQIMAIFLHKNSDFLKVIKEKLPIETMAEKMTVEFISTNV